MTSKQAGNTIDIPVQAVKGPDGKYSIKCQSPISVLQPSTINFQLDATSPVRFIGLTLPPHSGLGPVGLDPTGRQVSLVDPCTAAGSVRFQIDFKDEDGLAFSHDPEVINSPRL